MPRGYTVAKYPEMYSGKYKAPSAPKQERVLTGDIKKAGAVRLPGGELVGMADKRAIKMKTILCNAQAFAQILNKGVYHG